jgi:hypothetical protein
LGLAAAKKESCRRERKETIRGNNEEFTVKIWEMKLRMSSRNDMILLSKTNSYIGRRKGER